MRVIAETAAVRYGEWTLAEGTTILGRDPSCDICIPDPSVSRRHLKCTLLQGDLTVTDLNSRNGTWLGSQRIRAVRVRPGIRLRAGRVWLRFEEEPAPAADLSPLEQAVPVSADYEEDDEPTPADPTVAPAAQATGEARLVVRGDRWFVQDPATGTEVEIVPVGRHATLGAPEAVSAEPSPPRAEPAGPPPSVPARIGPVTVVGPGRGLRGLLTGRRRRIVLLGAALGLVLAVAAAVLLLGRREEVRPISRSEYRAIVDQAVRDFGAGRRREAIQALRDLATRAGQRQSGLAGMLLDAFRADQQAVSDFQQYWEKAQERWEEVADSSRSTQAAVELARARLDWLMRESENMARLNEAQRLLEEGRLKECLDCAQAVTQDSLFRKQAEPLIAQALEAVVSTALANAEKAEKDRNWSKAIGHLKDVIKYRPDQAEALQGRIADLGKKEAQRRILEEAKQLAAKRNYSQALQRLAALDKEGPYRRDMAILQKQWRTQDALQRATSLYDAGKGERALQLLSQAGLSDSPTYARIQSVLKTQERADQALQTARLDLAREQLAAILQLEPNKNNAYVRRAQARLSSLPQFAKALAQRLAEEAQAAVEERKFAEARRKFEEALLLDASNEAARTGLAQLRKDAVWDYNNALQLIRKEPEKALKLLNDVKDRLPPTDKYYRNADARILQIRERLQTESPEPAP